MSIPSGLVAHKGAFGYGPKSIAFGTAIVRATQGRRGAFTYLTMVQYTCAGTAHTLTFMRSASDAKTNVAASAAATEIFVDAALTDGDGNAIAANDHVMVEMGENDWHYSTVSAWDGTAKKITLNTAIPAGKSVPVGAKVCCYGIPGATYHADYVITTPTSATTNFPAVANGGALLKSTKKNEPLLVHTNNITATGTIALVSGLFSKV